MKKPWSISTTVRNPERVRDFLKVLKKLEDQEWTLENQRNYQIMLIQYKVYGYGNQQFYNGLSKKHFKLMSNPDVISFDEAKEVLESKNYKGGGDMRGRQSFNPLEKMGLAFLEDNKIKISAVGNYFLQENYDLGEVFFRSFLKWQLPNPDSRDFRKEDGFNINPFIATLKLIFLVNKMWSELNNAPVGINKKEFSLFVPTNINYSDIEKIAQEIINLRLKLQVSKRNKKELLEKFSKNYIKNFLGVSKIDLIEATFKNLKEYTDNRIRYFRLTRYIYIRGNGYYIDLEPRRVIEIISLLETYSGVATRFKTRKEYINYLSDKTLPVLPWDNANKLIKIAQNIINEIKNLEKINNIYKFEEKSLVKLTKEQLKDYIEKLREVRRNLQEAINYKKSQELENVESYIEILKNKIYSMDNRPLILEKYITLALNALNDALQIKPNYPVGDDNEPTNTAPAGEPDIECFYKTFNSICEVTLLRDRSQWFNEGQPVMRHLRDFEDKNNNKDIFCLFIAPSLHVDTIETFYNSVKYGYRGKRQKIIPLSLKQFVELLEIIIFLKENNNKLFSHEKLRELYENILDLNKISYSDEWINAIPNKIDNWKRGILNDRTIK